jgi:asparagine synthase (glutamine-hydrolysing)
MFSLAIWDTKKKVMTLSRDRMGEKPLYYGFTGENLVFGSELKSIKKFKNFNNQICKESLVKYFQYNYIPAPYCIYKDIYKLHAGHFIQFDCTQEINKSLKSQAYWSYAKMIENEINNQFSDFNEAQDTLENTLEKSIQSQLISDVPLGTFLSGGIDSSLITSLHQKNSMKPVKTFTIGFNNLDHNEAHYASAVAKHLGTEHSEITISNSDSLNTILELPKIFDEPFADSSQIPTILVSEMTKKKVTVALSGDGGDELFGGYNRYTHAPKIWSSISWLPFSARKMIGTAISQIGVDSYNFLGGKISSSRKIPHLGVKVHKVAARLKTKNNLQDFCLDFATIWENPNQLVIGMENFNDPGYKEKFNTLHFLNSEIKQMMAVDALTYLSDDILCKVDRASMSTSLETRVPFLDLDVMKVAARFPIKMSIQGRKGKIPLRKILEKYIPVNLIDRPKAGFSIPIGDWLRGPLRSWAESLLDPLSIEQRGLLNNHLVQQIWTEHLSGKCDWTDKLWSILMFQSWLEETESKTG